MEEEWFFSNFNLFWHQNSCLRTWWKIQPICIAWRNWNSPEVIVCIFPHSYSSSIPMQDRKSAMAQLEHFLQVEKLFLDISAEKCNGSCGGNIFGCPRKTLLIPVFALSPVQFNTQHRHGLKNAFKSKSVFFGILANAMQLFVVAKIAFEDHGKSLLTIQYIWVFLACEVFNARNRIGVGLYEFFLQLDNCRLGS